MLNANLKIIEELKEFISLVTDSPKLLEIFSRDSKSFTRSRKLPFNRLVLLIAKLCKKTLSIELEHFFEELKVFNPCTVSAFSQQRKKLNPWFYCVWNELLTASYYHYYGSAVKRWKGYRIIAGDGSCICLVNTPELEKHFGKQTNQTSYFVQAQAFYFYDVLNELTIHAKLAHCRTSELSLVYPMVDLLEHDMLMIYDRNFCNFKMFALHLWQEREIKFVIRANESRNFVKHFLQSGKSSMVAELKPDYGIIKQMYVSGYKITKETTIKIRLIRVELEKTVEVLVTNLWEEDGHPEAEFKELYFKRWGVETSISKHKNILQLESFSGLNPTSVEQDFHATVFTANLLSILAKEAQRIIDAKTVNSKYPMKINGNKSIGNLKTVLIDLFLSNQPEIVLKKLYKYFIRNPLPVRVNRSYERKVKNKHSRSKHKTFTNYKSAY